MIIDADPKKNLSTYTHFSSHWREVFGISNLSKNLIDRNAYQWTAQREQVVLSHARKITKCPENGLAYVTSGSSEGILLSLAFHLRRFKERRGSTERLNFVISELCHNVFCKFASIFDVEIRQVPANDEGSIDSQRAKAYVDRNTFCLVAIAGTTELGSIDDIRSLDSLAQHLNIPLHVDAAIGGYVLPYANNRQSWNFGDAKVSSMNLSPAKYGRAMPGVGVVLFADSTHLPSSYEYSMPYIAGGTTGDPGLLCSRNVLPVLSFANLLSCKDYGVKQREYILQCQQRADEVRELLLNAGFAIKRSSFPIVLFRHRDENKMESLLQSMRAKGYVISYAPISNTTQKWSRIVVRKNFTARVFKDLVRVLGKGEEYGIRKTFMRSSFNPICLF